MIAIHHDKVFDDVDTLHLGVHHVLHTNVNNSSDTVPILRDDQFKNVFHLIQNTKFLACMCKCS